jgi:hypothetical protein
VSRPQALLLDTFLDSATARLAWQELAAVAEALEAARRRMEHQKSMALRWINRQSSRMHAHLDHVANDKALLLRYGSARGPE